MDQYLNIKLTDINVTDTEKYPHMVSGLGCTIRYVVDVVLYKWWFSMVFCGVLVMWMVMLVGHDRKLPVVSQEALRWLCWKVGDKGHS